MEPKTLDLLDKTLGGFTVKEVIEVSKEVDRYAVHVACFNEQRDAEIFVETEKGFHRTSKILVATNGKITVRLGEIVCLLSEKEADITGRILRIRQEAFRVLTPCQLEILGLKTSK